MARIGLPDPGGRDEARRRGSDFPRADQRFKELTDIKLSIDGQVPRGFNVTGPRIVVTNRSRFTLTDVLIDLEFFTIEGRTSSKPGKTVERRSWQRVAKLDPDESRILGLGKVQQVKVTPSGTIYGTVTLDSRRGKSLPLSSK